MVSYLVTDALEDDAGSRFRRGDEVRFKVGGVTQTHNVGRLFGSFRLNVRFTGRLGNSACHLSSPSLGYVNLLAAWHPLVFSTCVLCDSKYEVYIKYSNMADQQHMLKAKTAVLTHRLSSVHGHKTRGKSILKTER